MKNSFQLFKKVSKLFKLTWREKLLFLEAFLLTGIIRFTILFLSFNKLARFSGKYKQESSKTISNEDEAMTRKVGWAVFAASKRTPWKSKCLVKALTAQVMLSTRRISSTLYLGVARDKEKKLIAHAWLRSGEDIITGVNEMAEFTEVARFANDGGRRTI